MRFLSLLSLNLMLAVLLAGCQQGTVDQGESQLPPPPASSTAATAAQAPDPAPEAASTSTSNQAATASEALSLPGQADLASFTFSPSGGVSTASGLSSERQGDRIEVTQNGQTVVVGTTRSGGWAFQDSEGTPIGKLNYRSDDGFKLKTPTEETWVKVKTRDNGWKVSDRNEAPVFKMNRYPDKVKAKSDDETELFTVPGTDRALAVTWLAIDSVPVPLRLALVTATWDGES